MLGKLRKIVRGIDLDEGKGFVVAQQDVVARHQALDEIALEKERFDLRMGDDDFHGGGFGDHPAQTVRQIDDMGVVGDAALEVACLADIERVAPGIEHAINARPWRQVLHDGANHGRPAGKNTSAVAGGSRFLQRRRVVVVSGHGHSRPGPKNPSRQPDLGSKSFAIARAQKARARISTEGVENSVNKSAGDDVRALHSLL